MLEVSLILRVCAAVNDGVSPNRKFIQLHSKMAKHMECDVVYKTPNIYAPSQFVFFFLIHRICRRQLEIVCTILVLAVQVV